MMAVRHLFDIISHSAIFGNEPSDCIKIRLQFFILLLTSAILRLTTKPEVLKELLGT